jgi:hypothetical protein
MIATGWCMLGDDLGQEVQRGRKMSTVRLLAAVVTEWFVFKQWVVICCLTRGKRSSFLMNNCNYMISNVYFLK